MLSDKLTKYFFNIVGQHEDFDIKHNIVRQNLKIIIFTKADKTNNYIFFITTAN